MATKTKAVNETNSEEESKPSRQQKRAMERRFEKIRDKLLANESLFLAVRVLQQNGFSPVDYEAATYLLSHMSRRVNGKSK